MRVLEGTVRSRDSGRQSSRKNKGAPPRCGGGGRRDESVCKPGSVEDDHSSGTSVTARLKRPTRIANA